MRFLIIILLIYLIYRAFKFYFTRKYSSYRNNNNVKRHSRPDSYKINAEDIIEAKFEDIEVKKGNSDINRE
ncbi:MAG TPA: hypothetical protein PL041_08160 [Melioribacteraceae bacterium]|nr:hypothetical protein [Melioribacteraceae bacterium]